MLYALCKMASSHWVNLYTTYEIIQNYHVLCSYHSYPIFIFIYSYSIAKNFHRIYNVKVNLSTKIIHYINTLFFKLFLSFQTLFNTSLLTRTADFVNYEVYFKKLVGKFMLKENNLTSMINRLLLFFLITLVRISVH